MAPNYARTDERRPPIPRRDSYRQGTERPQPARRDSRDSRYGCEPGEIRNPPSSRESRRDNEPPRSHNDPNLKPSEGPKRIPNSAAGHPDKPSDGLHFRRINSALEKNIATNNCAIENVATQVTPIAKNPKLQEAFENMYNWGEKSNKRLLLSIRKKKMAQESAQRRVESDKFLQKAPSFPPYNGLSDKFTSTDRVLEEQIKVAEDEYLRDLEQLVALFMTVPEPKPEPEPTTRHDQVIADFEAKVERLSQIAAKQTEQIQSLLEENKKYSALKSDHDALQSRFRTFDDTVRTLQSQQVAIVNENKSLKKELEDTRSDTEKKLKNSNLQLTGFINHSSDAAEDRKVFETGLDERVTGIEAKLADFTDNGYFKDKLDELDIVTFNEICEAWSDNLKSQYDEYKHRRRPDDLSIYEALRLLRQEVDSLRASQANVSQPDNRTALSIETIEAVINPKIEAATKAINEDTEKMCQGRDDIIGPILDATAARISALERGGSDYSGLEARIQLLEQWKVKSSAWINQSQGSTLAEQVTYLESKKISHKVDAIDQDVSELSQKYEALESKLTQLAKREWIQHQLKEILASVGIVNEMKDVQRRLPAIELAIKTLDVQFQNLSTKQLAELIVRLTNPLFEQRLGKLEVKAHQLEVKANGNDRTAIRHAEQLSSLNELLRSIAAGEKRTASPSHLDEPSKKRRLEVNGRHPSPLQQQRRNDSDQHPSS
ncbi:hypothetical protein F5Y12DRAFT_714119 [Xylaria sp. FL1777]|nr:hypothetical protein F5Y12DRAFT_714119 [Xylaria sp. FL1777]